MVAYDAGSANASGSWDLKAPLGCGLRVAEPSWCKKDAGIRTVHVGVEVCLVLGSTFCIDEAGIAP